MVATYRVWPSAEKIGAAQIPPSTVRPLVGQLFAVVWSDLLTT